VSQRHGFNRAVADDAFVFISVMAHR
jgi:hypothetical protein